MKQLRQLKPVLSLLSSAAVAVFAVVVLPARSLAQDFTVSGGAEAARGQDQVVDLFGATGVFSTITNILLFLVGVISVIMLIIGGLRYVLSGGNSSSVTAAKNTILYAIIGIVVALLAYAIVNFVIESLAPGTGGGGGVDV